MNRNLWGELPEPSIDSYDPYEIMQEQANYLSRLSNGLLIGRVSHPDCCNIFTMSIEAPLLQDYSCSIITCQKVVDSLHSYLDSNFEVDKKYECTNKTEFIEALQEILQSDPVRNVVLNLLRQAIDKCGGV